MLGNRFVGTINKDKEAFITHRDEKTHMFRMWEGIGWNKGLIKELNNKIKELWVFYHKTNGETILLKTKPEIILNKGIEWKNKKDIKDIQLILPLNEFEIF